jgi:hypothetical protein
MPNERAGVVARKHPAATSVAAGGWLIYDEDRFGSLLASFGFV